MQAELTKENNKQMIEPNKRDNFNVNAKQLLEQRPRSTGFKSFLNWFKKVENLQRNVEEESSSLSDSSEDDSSTSSTATVASFSFLPANIYKPYGDACQPEKFIASGPYTETYHRLITERNRRRNLDKNLSLRKKYSLYSSGTLGGRLDPATHHKVVHAENANHVQVYDTFSLPALAKKGDYDMEDFKDNRKTASLSSKDAKTAVNCHVKGKRKAPQPPASLEFSKTYRKKRQAPPPPKQVLFYTSHITEENIVISEAERQFQEKHKLPQSEVEKMKSIVQSELSPKPWYKRQGTENKLKTKNVKNNSGKKKSKHEYPEVGFFRCSRIFENKKQLPSETSEQDSKQEKRASCLLPNISELDREAAEIIKHHKKDLENRSDNGNIKQDQENLISKPSSARELINKFNALTNATDNDKLNIHRAKDDCNKSDEKSPPNLLVKKSDNNIVSNDSCSEKSQMSANAETCLNNKILVNGAKDNIKKPCVSCGLENITSGNTCISCINVQLTKSQDSKQENERNKNITNYIPPQSFQAEVFSAIANFNFSENRISVPAEAQNLQNNESAENAPNKQHKLTNAEEKFRLRELLKEMKNSLPKRPKPTKSLDADTTTNDDLKIVTVLLPTANLLQSAKNESLINVKTVPSNVIDVSQTKTKINLIQTSNDIILTKEEKIDLKSPKINLSESVIIKYEKPTKSNEQQMNADRPIKDSAANKVSSSAQTNCMIKKSDQLASANKQNVNVLGAEPKKDKLVLSNNQTKNPPSMEAIKEESKETKMASNALYINIQESRVAFPKPQISDQQKYNGNTKLLLKQLETAIAQGNDLLAAKLAKDLALLKVNCSVTSMATINAKEVNTKSIQIYIEDQFSHQGPITLRVKEDITITDLKTRVFEELHIPAGVQRWIIGKQLTTNDNLTLVHFNGNDFEVPLFLYVVAPVSELKTEKEVPNLPIPTEIAASNTPVKTENIAIIEEPKEINKKLPLKINIDLQEAKKNASPIIKVIPGPSKIKTSTESPALKDVTKKTWICSACTLINSLLSPLCSACGSRKSLGLEKKIDKKIELKPVHNEEHYLQLVNLDNADLVLNTEQFECPVCLMDCVPKAGVTLRECLHSFCKECLANTVKFSEEAEIKCPYRDKEYFCDSTIQEREIKSLVNKTLYEKHLAKSVNVAENKIKNTFHCKSPDCKGWCIFEENVNDFFCPVCKKTNCLTCQAIHEGKNCKEHQEQMSSNEAADGLRTKHMLEEMVNRGEAMVCPSCQVVLMKKWGCDWLRCSMCKTEICWVTRGPRWGTAGKGDTSGGCQCGLNGVKCHPKCNYCH